MKNQVFKLVLWILLFSSFFGIFSYQFAMYSVILSLVYMARSFLLRKQGLFKRDLSFYLIFYVISGVSCLIYEKQSMAYTFSSADSLLFFTILSYFVFISGKYTVSNIEKALQISNLIFLSFFLLQYLAMPRSLFSLATNYMEIGRFTMMGQLVTYFSMFFFFSKYLFENKTKYLYYCLPSLMVMFVAGFRTQLAVLVLILMVMTSIIKKTSTAKYVIIFAILSVLVYQIPLVQNSISNMLRRQAEGATYGNEDYIRLIQLNYFTEHHFKSAVEYVLGSGVPNPRSSYGMPFYTIDPAIGPYNGWRDWGLVGLSWIIGLPTVIFLLLPVVKILFTKCDKRLIYIKFFYIFLLMCSITTVEFFRVGSFFLHGLIFYYYEIQMKKNKLCTNEKN